MTDSILDLVKKGLGLAPEYDVFDPEIIMHINSTFMTLTQLGIGSDEGFMIEDNTATWTEYFDDVKNLNAVKTYVTFKVRLAFDPPATSFAIDSIQRQITELEWRLNVQVSSPALSGGRVWDLTGLADFPDEAVEGDIGIDFVTGDVYQKSNNGNTGSQTNRVVKSISAAVNEYLKEHPVLDNEPLLIQHLGDTTPHPVYDEIAAGRFIAKLNAGRFN